MGYAWQCVIIDWGNISLRYLFTTNQSGGIETKVQYDYNFKLDTIPACQMW